MKYPIYTARLIKIKCYLILVVLLVTFSEIQSTFAQSKIQHKYLPEFNLWLPGILQKNIYQNPPFITDSIFTWQFVQTQVFWTNDIFFVDSLYGWAAYNAAPSSGVMRTADSGFNWDTTGLLPGGSCLGVHFINRSTGWAVGSMGRIRKTTDGGFNWVKQDTFYYGIYYSYFYSVHFFNTETGIITGERAHGYPDTSWGGCVLKTTNSGVNWVQVYSTNDTIYSSTELHRQFWLNNDTGWFSGYNILLKTTDGGITFANNYSQVPPTQNGENGLLDLYFINENTGWISAANLDHKNIYKTTNAGVNWTFQDNPVAYYEYPQIDGIIFINSDTGWASSYVGIIIVTTDGGNNWVIDYNPNYWTNKFGHYGMSKVWVGAIFGRIYFTCLNEPNGIISKNGNLPRNYLLEQNYPNPFNPITFIVYQLPVKSCVKLVIYNILGEVIENLVDNEQNAGEYKLKWNAIDYPSGIYFCRLEAQEQKKSFIKTIKLILLK